MVLAGKRTRRQTSRIEYLCVRRPVRCIWVAPAALMMAMKHAIQPLLVAFLLCIAVSLAADQAESVPAALHAALAKNIQHAREWLSRPIINRWPNLPAVCSFLRDAQARSDDAAWQASTGKIANAAADVQTPREQKTEPSVKRRLLGSKKRAAPRPP